MSTINPNHAVTQATEGHWYKIAAALLCKLPDAEALVTTDDLDALSNLFGAEEPVIVAHARADGLHLYLLPRSRAEVLARQAGGLPV